MIGYTIVGTKDLPKAKAFYDPLFTHMNLPLCFEDAQVASWGDKTDDTVPRFFVCYPFDDQPATVGNGSMTAFRVETASDVDALHDLAIRSGGADEGKPGFRPEAYGDKFYVAYVRDLDGNKLAFACYDGKSNP
ncbi:VOC family protein [Tateyamaria omphalii]|uniref:VOC family protein n=1 Tax=Tateyamaria omphalii TaxID=299262 RepID=UPI001C995571|nr:VOC family protein [Tateyamaria omphalii]MBY5934682.1 VOC family protein [Tateyamaria omphalii]